ncbi:MAG: hypothetical protein ACFCU9_00700, partial [Cyanophyceae cyanobacterium]
MSRNFTRRWILKGLVMIVTGLGIQGSPLAAAGLDEGLAAFRAERYHEALTLWQEALRTNQQISQRIPTLIYLSLAHQALGEWPAAAARLSESFSALETLPSNELSPSSNLRLKAQALNAEGSLHLGIGQPQAAFVSWQQATAAYQQAQDAVGALGSRLNQAQAL